MSDDLHADYHGTWLPIRAELDSQLAPDLALTEMKLTLTAKRYVVHFGREASDQGTCAMEPGSDPVTLVINGTRGANAGRTLRAIVQLRGDRLRICFGLDGITPTAFATSPGSHRYLVTYRRG